MITYLLPPLNALRAFEAAARHLSFKLAHELLVTAGAVNQQVKVIEERLGLRLFERRHRQLVLTPEGQRYLPALREAFGGIAAATDELKPERMSVVVNLGVHAAFDVEPLRARLARFRKLQPKVGLPRPSAGGPGGAPRGKVDLAIEQGLSRYPTLPLRSLEGEAGVGDFLLCPIGTAGCPEIELPSHWLLGARPFTSMLVGGSSIRPFEVRSRRLTPGREEQ